MIIKSNIWKFSYEEDSASSTDTIPEYAAVEAEGRACLPSSYFALLHYTVIKKLSIKE